jgi:hypothetical protein
MTTHPHGRAMFSDAALKAFKEFVDIDAATAGQRPRGAQDAMTTKLRQALNRCGLVFDEMTGAPDPETINSILKVLGGSIHDAGIVKIMKALHNRWPGCVGEINDGGSADDDFIDDTDEPTEDEADADSPPGNPNPNRNIRGRGTEGFSHDNPPPFSGMPKPGGKMVEMASDAAIADYEALFPDTRRIKLDPCVAMNPRNVAETPITMRASRRGIAMDSAHHASDAAADYNKMFPSARPLRVL